MRLILAFVIVGILASCSNEFEVLEDPKEIPLVYAVIDPAQENQYFRVERVFSEEGKSGLELAKDPAQLYFEDITVKLKRGSEEFSLTKINGEDEGMPRDTGVFSTVPNVLYKISTEELMLEVGENFELVIDGIFDDRSVTSSATIIDQAFIAEPTQLSLVAGKNKRVNWNPQEGNAIYSFQLEIDLTEINNSAGTNVDKTLVWNLGNAIVEEEVTLIAEEFQQFLSGELEVDEDIIRFLGNVRYKITAGDKNIADRIRIAGANLGITSSGDVPEFTNMSEGIGLFASKNTRVTPDFQFTGDTKLELQESPFTMGLNLQN